MRLVKRSSPLPRSQYADYRQELRRDFEFSCAYCTMLELEAMGIGFEIDHYDPVTHNAALANEYTNLVYSCDSCNGRKSSYLPEPDPARPEVRLLRPDLDDFDEHAEMKTDLHLKERTPAGRYTIKLIGLNRKTLLRLRQIRRDAQASDAFVQNGLRGLSEMRADELPMKWRHELRELQKKHVAIPPTDNMLVELLVKSRVLPTDPDEDRMLLAERRQYLAEIQQTAGVPIVGRK
jgi:HNH endonuclease